MTIQRRSESVQKIDSVRGNISSNTSGYVTLQIIPKSKESP